MAKKETDKRAEKSGTKSKIRSGKSKICNGCDQRE